MHKILLALVPLFLGIANALAGDLDPKVQITGMYCYGYPLGGTGAFRAVLTDKPMEWGGSEPALREPVLKHEAKAIGLLFEGHHHWSAEYTNKRFYDKHSQAAIECLKKIAGHGFLKEEPLPRNANPQKVKWYRF